MMQRDCGRPVSSPQTPIIENKSALHRAVVPPWLSVALQTQNLMTRNETKMRHELELSFTYCYGYHCNEIGGGILA